MIGSASEMAMPRPYVAGSLPVWPEAHNPANSRASRPSPYQPALEWLASRLERRPHVYAIPARMVVRTRMIAVAILELEGKW